MRFIFFILVLCSQSLWAGPLEEFAQSSTWKKLLHIDGMFNRSRVDGVGFFWASNGARDPLAELRANIAAMQQQQSTFHCKFPLRAKRISAALGIAVPQTECPELEKWLSTLRAHAISVVYASAFPEAPPSMFGHLFFHLASDPTKVDINLFDLGLNFAAVIPEDAGIEMAHKGLFGGYEGHFTIAPIHQMLSEYSFVEERDLWIYRLKLNSVQTTELLLHIWEIEMNRSYLSYYFIDENCAYQLIAALEAVIPDLQITEEFGLYSLPITAVQGLEKHSLLSEPRLVRRAPAKLNRESVSALSPSERQQFYDLVRGIAVTASIPILDLAVEHLSAEKRSVRGQWNDDKERTLQKLLHERASRKTMSKPTTLVDEQLDQPLSAHKTAQGGVEFRRLTNRSSYGLYFKPALHHLLARGPGFGEGMHLETLAVNLQVFPKVDFHNLTIVDIGVLQPLQTRYASSWRILFDLNRDDIGTRVLHTSGRTGLTTNIFLPRLVGFALVGIDLSLSKDRFRPATALQLGVASADAWDMKHRFPLAFEVSGQVQHELQNNKLSLRRIFEATSVLSLGERTEFRCQFSAVYHETIAHTLSLRIANYF